MTDETPGADESLPSREAIAREVGQAIREARVHADLSQSELGKRLTTRNGTPVNRVKISSYERGEWLPEPRIRPQLAKALGVPEEVLFAALHPGAARETLVTRLERVERELTDLRALVEGK
jgi:transcriptional regulator with XRE-family HTH domain